MTKRSRHCLLFLGIQYSHSWDLGCCLAEEILQMYAQTEDLDLSCWAQPLHTLQNENFLTTHLALCYYNGLPEAANT